MEDIHPILFAIAYVCFSCKRAATLRDSDVAKSGGRFNCSFRKKAGEAIEHSAEKMPDSSSHLPYAPA